MPGEWTPSMFQKAALALLEVNRIARSFGFETKDGSLYNLSFVGTRSVFFDLGSFVRRDHHCLGWRGYDQFIQCVLQPLILVCQRNALLRHWLFDLTFERGVTFEEYLRLRLGLLAKCLPCGTLARGHAAYEKFRWVGTLPNERLHSLNRSRFVRLLLKAARDRGLIKLLTGDLPRLEARLRRLISQPPATNGSAHQQSVLNPGDDPLLGPHHERACELLAPLKPVSVVEFGGSAGALGLALHLRGIARHVTSIDCDVEAAEQAFALFSRRGPACTAAVIDFLAESNSIRIPSVAERCRAHTVVALSLTHHLILSRGVEATLLMGRLAAFCTDYALVGFMPRGLRNSSIEQSLLPPWYLLEWFRNHFLEQFDLMHEEKLEGDRVVLLGRKRPL